MTDRSPRSISTLIKMTLPPQMALPEILESWAARTSHSQTMFIGPRFHSSLNSLSQSCFILDLYLEFSSMYSLSRSCQSVGRSQKSVVEAKNYYLLQNGFLYRLCLFLI